MQPCPIHTGCPPTVQPPRPSGKAVIVVNLTTGPSRPIWPQTLGVLLILSGLLDVLHLLGKLSGLLLSAGLTETSWQDSTFMELMSFRYFIPIPIPGLSDMEYGGELLAFFKMVFPLWVLLLALGLWQIRIGQRFYGQKRMKLSGLRIWLLLSLILCMVHVWMNMEIFDRALESWRIDQFSLMDLFDSLFYQFQGLYSYTQWSSDGPDLAGNTFLNMGFAYVGSIWPQLLLLVCLLFSGVRQQIGKWS